MSTKTLTRALLHAETVALVGASATRGRVGRVAPTFQLEIAFSRGSERWGRVVRVGWRLERVGQPRLT